MDEACEIRQLIGECEVIDFLADDDYADGDVVAVEDALLIVRGDVADTETGVGVVKGRIRGPKAAVEIVAGENAYFDDSARDFTNVVASNRKCGYFPEAHATGVALAELEFDGYGS